MKFVTSIDRTALVAFLEVGQFSPAELMISVKRVPIYTYISNFEPVHYIRSCALFFFVRRYQMGPSRQSSSRSLVNAKNMFLHRAVDAFRLEKLEVSESHIKTHMVLRDNFRSVQVGV